MVGCQHNVFRLDIAMNDAPRVRLSQRLGHLFGNGNGLAQIGAAIFEPRRQGFALNVLKDDKAVVAFLADIVNRTYVRVVESRRGSCLAKEALPREFVGSDLGGKELDCDFAAELTVFRQINYAHAAPAKLLEDAIVRNGLANHVCA